MDHLSLNSGSSDNPSSEFEVVSSNGTDATVSNSETGLKIAGDGDVQLLKKNLEEVMIGSDSSVVRETKEDDHGIGDNQEESLLSETTSPKGSVEKLSDSTTDSLNNQSPDADNDCILFNGLFYLGCASVSSPRNKEETLKTISILRAQHVSSGNQPTLNISSKPDTPPSTLIEVVLSVPSRADGLVRLLDPEELSALASFKLYTILFCIRGTENTDDSDCFAFTESHQASGIFQCHVFRCDIPEAVRKVLYSFELAFRSIPKSPTEEQNAPMPSAGLQLLKRTRDSGGVEQSSSSTASDMISPEHAQLALSDHAEFRFSVTLEVKEDDGKGTFVNIPWDKTSSCYKFRQNLCKRFNLNITQTSNVELTIERCFGLLLSPGRNIKHSDMHLLDMEKSVTEEDPVAGASHFVTGIWDPTQPQFEMLNTETAKGSCLFLSVAVDFVIQEIQEPVRFLIETQASIYPQNEKFWTFGKKVLQETFFLRLREADVKRLSTTVYAVEGMESASSRNKRKSVGSVSETVQPEEDMEEDNDEPLLSGSGEVSMDCSEKVLTEWGQVLIQWRSDLSRRPSGVRTLVRSASGVPEALRGEVWQLLAGCHDNSEMLEKYRLLIAKDSPQENIIQRDIHRTFPAHDYFREAGGEGQESLYRIAKAYSVHDHEVGYCQGLSFLEAALLLHMPEEQAFCVLVSIMYDYHMRNMFKNGFEDLHLKFYQLERLMEDLMPNLNDHFKQLGVECHMFSSQWFLTLFTAKFPLNMVYHVLDIFLCEGELVVFQVALGLLECCRKELLTHDFEGVLKYFRVQLPKKYRNEDQVKLLTRTAVRMKVTQKKLARYLKDYQTMKEKMALEEDPLIRIEKENKKLMESNMRLELENDDIAQELVTTRITLNTQLQRLFAESLRPVNMKRPFGLPKPLPSAASVYRSDMDGVFSLTYNTECQTMQHADDLQRELQSAVDELRTTRQKNSELKDENTRLLEETTQVKEMCRREVARYEEDLKGKTNIISDYKTICSQLSQRIENMQTQHQLELETVRKGISNGHNDIAEVRTLAEERAYEEKEILQKQTRNLELELAQTKLKLVEAECRVQDVEHLLSSATKELQASKNTWIHKTFSSLTNKKTESNVSIHSPTSNLSVISSFGSNK